MKKNVGLAKALDIIPVEDLQTWETRRLLARLKRLRWCYEEVAAADDYSASEIAEVQHKILFKTDPRWKQAYKELKAILGERENIQTKP